MPVIDLVFVILIGLMVVHGYVKGFIEELFSWATLVLAVWVAVLFYQAGGEFIRTKIMENVRLVPEILAFVAIFFIVVLFLKMLERVLKDVIQGARLGNVNKVIGAIFGIVEGLALTMLVLFVLSVQPLFDPSGILGESAFADLLLPLIRNPLDKGIEIIEAAIVFGIGSRRNVFLG